MVLRWLWCGWWMVALVAWAQDKPSLQTLAQVRSLLGHARAAHDQDQRIQALAWASKAIQLEPRHAESWMFRGRLHEAYRDHQRAVADYARAVDLDASYVEARLRRGFERFRLGRVAAALLDFDKYCELAPAQAPHLWQRGIALYCLGRYAEARRQFESHRTVNPNDVETAAWHFLCLARTDGLEAARAALMPVTGDPRVPMPEIHRLYAGKAEPGEVLAAVAADEAGAKDQEVRRFYAHLYLGLFHEVAGAVELARTHLLAAVAVAEKNEATDYMGDVASVYTAPWRNATHAPTVAP